MEVFALQGNRGDLGNVGQSETSVIPGVITIRLTHSDGGWTSQVVEFPAAISQGDTASAATANVLDALFEVLADERIC